MKAKQPLICDGVTLWQCPACQTAKPSADFYADSRAANGLKPQCKACHIATTMRTRDPEKQREANREHMRRARNRDPEKFRARERNRKPQDPVKVGARQILNAAVHSGEVIRPSCCALCSGGGRIEAHHSNYSRPLDVLWLCTLCHGKFNRGPRERRIAA